MSGIQTNLKDMGKALNQMTSQDKFEIALTAGHLSKERDAENYVGKYMFMGETDGILLFKHIYTREYYNYNPHK